MTTIKIGKDDVELDDNILNLNHETINDFLSKYASWHRYYQNKYNDASYICKKITDKFNSTLQSKFRRYKEEKQCSDKMAEALAKSDEEVLGFQEKMRTAEYVKDELWGFLRSMDYAHENALQICYNIRKELHSIGYSSIKSIENSIENSFEKDIKNVEKIYAQDDSVKEE